MIEADQNTLSAPAAEDSAKRRQILQGARKVFMDLGFDGASMGEIARAAGVSKGTLYVYFEDKSRLFEAIVHEETVVQGKAAFTYGRFEVRVKTPTGPTGSTGRWPAFWLRPDDGGNGEIDVTELPGGAAYYKAATQAIFLNYTPVKQDTRIPLPGGGYPGDGFHTYTTEWDANSLKWYIDGKLVWTRDRSTTPWFEKAFTKPYNIRLNFQVGGWLGNPDSSTQFPADFVVDYVRVYQH